MQDTFTLNNMKIYDKSTCEASFQICIKCVIFFLRNFHQVTTFFFNIIFLIIKSSFRLMTISNFKLMEMEIIFILTNEK